MTRQDKPFLHTAMIKIGSSPPGAWLFARIGHHIDRFVLRRTNGRTSLTNLLSGAPIVNVTTTGAKSGLPRTLPLTAVRDPNQPENLALIASNWGQGPNPSWYYNLKANPRATCMLEGQEAAYHAHEAAGAEYTRYWELAAAIYQGFPKYQERNSHRQIPIMVLTPIDQP